MNWHYLLSFWIGFCLCFTIGLIINDKEDHTVFNCGFGGYVFAYLFLFCVVFVWVVPLYIYSFYKVYRTRKKLDNLKQQVNDMKQEINYYNARDYN